MRKCIIEDCSNRVLARNLCNKHYKRYLKYGDPSIVHHITIRRKFRTHGLSQTPEYPVWQGIKRRCLNKNEAEYFRYGGRGIKICDRWRDSFVNFYADMGPRPSSQYTIDRIDVNGDYAPSNCRWATRSQNTINRRTKIGESGYRGVYRHGHNKWVAKIGINLKRIRLGTFNTPLEAAIAYNKAANKLHKEFARLNKVA